MSTDREKFVKELMASNGWTQEKAEEFCVTKSAILNMELNLRTLPEVLPLLQKHGLVHDMIQVKLVIPMTWLSNFKAEAQALLGPAYLDKATHKLPDGGLLN